MHNFYISHTAFNVFYFINKKIILRARKLTSKTRNVGFQRLLYKKEIFFEKRYRFFFSGGCSLWHPGYRSKRFFGRCLQVLVGRETNKGFSLSHTQHAFVGLPTNESTNPQYVSKNQRHQRPSDKMLLKNNDIAQVKNITPP